MNVNIVMEGGGTHNDVDGIITGDECSENTAATIKLAVMMTDAVHQVRE